MILAEYLFLNFEVEGDSIGWKLHFSTISLTVPIGDVGSYLKACKEPTSQLQTCLLTGFFIQATISPKLTNIFGSTVKFA